jgi:hypothetical protein
VFGWLPTLQEDRTRPGATCQLISSYVCLLPVSGHCKERENGYCGYKEEYRGGDCKAERKCINDGSYKEKRKKSCVAYSLVKNPSTE